MHYLLATGAFNRPAIMRAAWAAARKAFANRPRFALPTTLRECFAKALRDVWGAARAHRDIAGRLTATRAEAPAFRGVGRRAARSIPTRAFGARSYWQRAA